MILFIIIYNWPVKISARASWPLSMGNAPSRSFHSNQEDNNSSNGSERHDIVEASRAIIMQFTRYMVQRASRRSGQSDVAGEMPRSPSTASTTTSTTSGSRYNLRRTVTRVRREQAVRSRTPVPMPNAPENSRTFDESPEDVNRPSPLQNPTNTAEMMQSIENNRDGNNRTPGLIDGPRITDANLFGSIVPVQENERSIFFTFPLRRSNAAHHIVLVRVRHLASQQNNTNESQQNSTNESQQNSTGQNNEQEQQESLDGVLQWTLYFLLPQSQAPSDGQQPESLSVDPSQVLTEAFAAFNALIADDAMSYEEISRLQELMGFVSRGVSTELINEQIKTVSFKQGLQSFGANCSICLAEYKDQESCRKLPCSHGYHSECIDKWLNQVNQCPLCRQEAVTKPTATTS